MDLMRTSKTQVEIQEQLAEYITRLPKLRRKLTQAMEDVRDNKRLNAAEELSRLKTTVMVIRSLASKLEIL